MKLPRSKKLFTVLLALPILYAGSYIYVRQVHSTVSKGIFGGTNVVLGVPRHHITEGHCSHKELESARTFATTLAVIYFPLVYLDELVLKTHVYSDL